MYPSARFVLACSVAALLARTSSSAADPSIFIWDGGDGSSTSFTEATNWSLNVAPDGNDVLRFPTATNRTVTGINAYNGFRIFFETGADSYTLSGTGATLFDFTADNNNGAFYSAGANAPKIENNSANLQTLNLALTFNSTTGASEINPVDGDLLFGSTVAVTGGQQLRILGGNGKTVTFNGIISGANSTVAINQNSNVVYGAANSYSGDTFINAGSLSFAQGGSLTGGTLQLGDTNATVAAATLRISDLDGGTTIARPIVVRAGSTGAKTIAASNTSGTNAFSGTVALNDSATVDVASGGALTLSGIVSGAGSLTKSGNGLLNLTAANSFSGGLTINAGTVRPSVLNTMSGGILVNTGGTLETNTAGADSTAYSGFFGGAGNGITLNGGRLLDTNATDRTVTNKPITIGANGGVFEIAGTVTNFIEGAFTQLRFATAAPTNDILTGSGTITKNGGGRLTLNSGASPNFSGAWIINAGTVEALGATLGNASATNTITINGGNLATSGGTIGQAMTLNGGALSTTGASRTVTGAMDVTADSYVFLNDFWRDFDAANATGNIGRTITHSGVLSGNDALGIAVNRTGYRFNNGAVVLQNVGNTYSGTITVGKNLRLENNPTGGIGKTLGTANIVLAGGGLNLRDDGAGDGGTLTYGNNVSVVDPSGIFDRGTLAASVFIDVNRTATGLSTANTFRLGTFNIGSQVLTVSGGNSYGVEFGGAAQITANANFNPTTASLTFSGGLTEDAAGRTLTKTGNGALVFTSEAAYTGATSVNGGSLVLAGTSGKLNGTPSIALTGATLGIDNSAAIVADRVVNTVPISVANGAIAFTSLAGTATNTSETLGAVTLSGGSTTIAANQGNPGAISALTLSSLTRQNSATVKFVGTNLGQTGNSSRIILADQSSNVTLLAPWMTINGTEFAQYATATDGGFVRGVTSVSYVTDPVTDGGLTAADNLRLTGTSTTFITANRAVSTVNFANDTDTRTLDIGSNTLTVAGGGMIVGTNAAAITGTAPGGLTSGTPELVITANAPLDISAPIKNGNGAVGVTKVGAGTLTLSGASTFTGDLSVTQGTLSVSDVANTGAASNLGAGSTVRLSDVAPATLEYTGFDDETNRPLIIGSPGATVNVTTPGAFLTWNGNITNAGSFTKVGPGVLVLGGTASIAGNANVTGESLTLNGATTISGDLNVGVNGIPGIVTGQNSTLSVGSGSSNAINIGVENVAVGTASNGTVDLSASTGFTANVGTIRIGAQVASGNDGGSNTGALILPPNSTITAATSIVVADSPGNGDAGLRGALTFGSGTNDVTTPLLTVGGRKYSAVGNIAAGGTLLLDNGANRTTLNVGTNTGVDTGTVPVSSFNLTGGTIVASLSNVAIGIRSGGGNGDVTGTLNLGNNSGTNVNINVGSGIGVRIGGLDFGGGTQPTNEIATGTLAIGGGTVSITSTINTSSAVVVGHFNGTTAITGATAANAANGTLTIDGGDVTITSAGTANAINLGAHAVAAGTVGSNTASGTLNINGGTLTVNNPIIGNSTVASSTSNLNLTGGVLNMAGKNISNINNLNFTGGTLRNLGTLNRALTQTGEASLLDVVANNSTIQGAYSVTDGDVRIAATRTLSTTSTALNGTASLLVNGSLQGALTVNAGALVGGAGTTQALALAGGTIAPGNSPGILGTGNLSLGGGNLSLEINSPTAGTGYDQLNVVGTVSLTANTNFTLTLGYVPSIGDTYAIINNDGADAVAFTGGALLTFNGGSPLADDTRFTTAQGFEFEINYNGGSSNNDVVLVTTVPEPASATVLFAGVGLLAGLRRFRRSQRP